jgi:hypothetical protein
MFGGRVFGRFNVRHSPKGKELMVKFVSYEKQKKTTCSLNMHMTRKVMWKHNQLSPRVQPYCTLILDF